jgi:hypothetical protein
MYWGAAAERGAACVLVTGGFSALGWQPMPTTKHKLKNNRLDFIW